MKRASLASLALLLVAAGVVAAQKPAAQEPLLADLHPGEGWQELELAAQPKKLRARAWSDPAAGCHLISFQIQIPATAQIDPLTASFAKTLKGKSLQIADLEGQGDRRRGSLSGDNISGYTDLRLQRQSPTEGKSSASLLACYWNEREPEHCRSICEGIIDRGPAGVSP